MGGKIYAKGQHQRQSAQQEGPGICQQVFPFALHRQQHRDKSHPQADAQSVGNPGHQREAEAQPVDEGSPGPVGEAALLQSAAPAGHQQVAAEQQRQDVFLRGVPLLPVARQNQGQQQGQCQGLPLAQPVCHQPVSKGLTERNAQNLD